MAALPPQPIGQSEAFHALLAQVSDAASLEMPVLVTGERGTGKELIASRLHFLSPRWEQAYIRVNCAAFTEEMLEVELFGSAAGRGQGERSGQFEAADGGTLFLDNICAAPSAIQEKLLRTIEHGEFAPRGSSETLEVDVRIVSASAHHLPHAVAMGEFHADLLDRLAFNVVTLPPLRVRPDDIQPLTALFGRKMATRLGAEQFPGFAPEVMDRLLQYPWPGNVRELKNVVERSLAQHFLIDESLSTVISEALFDPFAGPWAPTETAPLQMTPAPIAPVQTTVPLSIPMPVPASAPTAPQGSDATAPPPVETPDFTDRVLQFERGLIDEALFTNKNHQGKAADYLGLSYHQFRGLLRKHGMKK